MSLTKETIRALFMHREAGPDYSLKVLLPRALVIVDRLAESTHERLTDGIVLVNVVVVDLIRVYMNDCGQKEGHVVFAINDVGVINHVTVSLA